MKKSKKALFAWYAGFILFAGGLVYNARQSFMHPNPSSAELSNLDFVKQELTRNLNPKWPAGAIADLGLLITGASAIVLGFGGRRRRLSAPSSVKDPYPSL